MMDALRRQVCLQAGVHETVFFCTRNFHLSKNSEILGLQIWLSSIICRTAMPKDTAVGCCGKRICSIGTLQCSIFFPASCFFFPLFFSSSLHHQHHLHHRHHRLHQTGSCELQCLYPTNNSINLPPMYNTLLFAFNLYLL